MMVRRNMASLRLDSRHVVDRTLVMLSDRTLIGIGSPPRLKKCLDESSILSNVDRTIVLCVGSDSRHDRTLYSRIVLREVLRCMDQSHLRLGTNNKERCGYRTARYRSRVKVRYPSCRASRFSSKLAAQWVVVLSKTARESKVSIPSC
jgi:hypothetical protein